jgi:hypothetical protein
LGASREPGAVQLLVRRHDRDCPLLPLKHEAIRDAFVEIVRAASRSRGLAADISETLSTREPFEAYRLPHRLTMEEGAMSDLRVTEVVFQGPTPLNELPSLAKTIAGNLARVTSTRFAGTTVVVGRPFITPLEGDRAGLRTLTDVERAIVVGVAGDCADENEWFLPAEESEWDAICDARVTESEWVRLYHRRLDAALAYEIVTPVTPIEATIRQITHDGWMRSVFALLPEWEKWPYEILDEPDETAAWSFEPGRVICGWFHPFAGGGFILLPADSGDEPPIDPVDEAGAETRLAAIRRKLESVAPGALVSAERARHMIALVGRDPLAGDRPTVFRTADVLRAFASLPSPISPSGRMAELTVAWRAGDDAMEPISTAAMSLALGRHPQAAVTSDDGFIVLTARFPSLPPSTPSSVWFEDLAQLLDRELAGLERELTSKGIAHQRATAEYWAIAHEVRLGVPWHLMGKMHGVAVRSDRPAVVCSEQDAFADE